MKRIIVAFGCLVWASGVFSAVKAPAPAPVPACATTNDAQTVWIDGRDLPLEGKAFADVRSFYDRVPACVASNTNINRGVWANGRHAAGMCFRFVTDATKLRIRWDLMNAGLAMSHMPATGVSGIDVYGWSEQHGWRFVRNGRPRAQRGNELTLDWTKGRPVLIYLPLYNGITSFKLGLPRGASVKPLPPRANGAVKPVVFYGTSITHGACASRPGMAWVNQTARLLDRPAVNLGFSGAGKMERDMVAILARVDADCYVLDCLWNMSVQMVRERFEPFLRALRQARPGVPIVCAEDCCTFSESTPKGRLAREIVEKLRAEGWHGLYFLSNAEQMACDSEETVDGCHPNDLGMTRMANAFARVIRQALEKP